MEIIKVENYDKMSKKAFEIFKEQIDSKPESVFGLATGSTPLGLYGLLVEEYKDKELNFKTVNLDEYIGLEKEHDQSYYRFMYDNLFSKLNIPASNYNIPKGLGENNLNEFIELLNTIGKRDIQLLGIGANGHIGFVEPQDNFSKDDAIIVELTDKTIQDNARFFENDISQVPTKAITMGIPQILNSDLVLILASGTNKAQAVHDAIKGEVSPKCPASVLQNHKNVVWIIDNDAASLI